MIGGIGCLIFCSLADKYTFDKYLTLMCILLAFGLILQAFSWNKYQFIIGSFISFGGVGIIWLTLGYITKVKFTN